MTNNNLPAQQGPKPTKIELLKGMLNAPSVQEQFNSTLKENAGGFIASIIELFNGDGNLQQCEPKAIVMEALKAATLKLPINKQLGFAYIIPFNNSIKQADGSWKKVMTPTFQPGYKGYIQLAMRTGQYRIINTDIVYEGELKTRNKLTGEIDFTGQRTGDKPVGYFAHIELLNGFAKTLYMSKEDVTRHAETYSKSYKSATSAWKTDFDKMAMKTVIRNLLSHYGYLSIEMQTAIVNDTDTSIDERGEAINAGANKQEFDAADVTFEDVSGPGDNGLDPDPETETPDQNQSNKPKQPEMQF